MVLVESERLTVELFRLLAPWLLWCVVRFCADLLLGIECCRARTGTGQGALCAKLEPAVPNFTSLVFSLCSRSSAVSMWASRFVPSSKANRKAMLQYFLIPHQVRSSQSKLKQCTMHRNCLWAGRHHLASQNTLCAVWLGHNHFITIILFAAW